MKHAILCAFVVLGLISLIPFQTYGKNVLLEVGETYTEEGLNVICIDSKDAGAISIKECQHWDEFNSKCLFERKIHIYHDMECIEECQHWDSFNSKCNYATKCTFFAPQKLFIRTTCEEFDSFSKSCKRTKESKIVQ